MLGGWRYGALVCILLATLIGVGIVQGLWTDRWGGYLSAVDLDGMEKMPPVVGAWEGRPQQETPDQKLLPNAQNYVRRVYVNQTDGTIASVMLTHGRPGPLVMMHLPTECYPSTGFDLIGQPQRFVFQGSDGAEPDEFWVATFKKTTDVLPLTVRVYWSWTADGHWRTPDSPRLTFANHPVLYKMYFVKTLVNENEAFEGAPVHDLIKKLTSAMRGSVFPKQPQ